MLNIFAGTSFLTGILLAGSVSLIYRTLGGLWADVVNDFAQFLVQLVAGISTFSFNVLTILIAINAESFGGVFELIVSWFAAFLGPLAIPMIPGLLPAFRRCESKIANISIVAGITGFIIVKLIPGASLALEVGVPLFTTLLLYIAAGLMSKRAVPERVDNLQNSISK